MPYGIANSSGRLSSEDVAAILARAREVGINMLDTAVAYGDCEAILGRVGVAGWKVVTKLPPVPQYVRDIVGWMEAQVTGSLSRLGIGCLYGLLLHAPVQMHGPRAEQIAQALDELAERGFTSRIGVSIQRPAQDIPAVLKHMTPSIIQSPFNLLDDALVAEGWAASLRAQGCEVHARSAFLQGLLVMEQSARPAWSARWAKHWQEWEAWLGRTGISASEACIRFVRSQAAIDYCVVGVDSVAQLDSLLGAGADPLPSLPNWPAPPDHDLIEPSRWPTT